jgi:hypothetical protein
MIFTNALSVNIGERSPLSILQNYDKVAFLVVEIQVILKFKTYGLFVQSLHFIRIVNPKKLAMA